MTDDNQQYLEAARRHINDSVDSLDELSEQSTSSVVAIALLTGARVAVNARLASEDDGDESPSA